MIHNKESIPCIIGSTIGMAGSLIFIIVYTFIKEIRDSARKFILILAIYDFLLGFFAILPGHVSSGLCKVQAIFLSFVFVGACCFIFLVSLVFYLKICHGKNVDESKTFFIVGNIIGSFVALIAAVMSISFGEVGTGYTHWCWIRSSRLEAVDYSIVWIVLLGTVILYTLLYLKIRKEKKYSKSFHYKIFVLGWIYLLTELFTSIKRARQIINPDAKDNLFLDVMQSLTVPMLGLWDAVFFVFADKNVRSFIYLRLKKRNYEELKGSNLEDSKMIEFTIHN
ncbi:adhesion g protein-coupled receptor b2 [Anaeramoeba ignava]|uniref:Adhesion g protein-coupled receptor b2 n=1 Tax=Anaeramoeba ignava TaxID=1746090 RepID=A0A9Q0LN01_ANAIG|nr:adhesion g protein-coupled receptor b2 [Anaeramoeba ignava]